MLPLVQQLARKGKITTRQRQHPRALDIDTAHDEAQGTLDAMLYGSLWDPEDEVKKNVGAYVDEVTPSVVHLLGFLSDNEQRSLECSGLRASGFTLHIGSRTL